jgi:cold-inducible RNA-binding protein
MQCAPLRTCCSLRRVVSPVFRHLISCSRGAHYQPVHDEILRVLDGDLSARKLFVRNLPFDVEEAAVRGLMAEFGEMTECMVVKDRATGKGRGFAFVTFGHVEDADKALVAKSRPLAVRLCISFCVCLAPVACCVTRYMHSIGCAGARRVLLTRFGA